MLDSQSSIKALSHYIVLDNLDLSQFLSHSQAG